jgi:AcrR family transcriptional regulator
MSPRSKTSGRERLLEAAEQLIIEGGLGQLSVDAVLGRAGLSKGAFFHHFESRDALLAALIERLALDVDHRIAERSGVDPEKHGLRLRTQIAMTFDSDPTERVRLQALVLAFIEAALAGSSFVTTARATNEAELRANLKDGVPMGDALVVQFALDGYWLNEALGAVQLADEMRSALRESLVRLTRMKKE